MADWTNILTSSLEPGDPVRAIDVIALRDNPVAIAEGDPQAPRIRTAALQPPSAGDTYLIYALQNAEKGTDATAYAHPGEHRFFSSSRHIGVLVLVPGVIRCKLEAGVINSGTTGRARVLRNEVQVVEWNISIGEVYIQRSVDIDVSVGDIVIFQLRSVSGGDVGWRNIRIYSNNPDIAVA